MGVEILDRQLTDPLKGRLPQRIGHGLPHPHQGGGGAVAANSEQAVSYTHLLFYNAEAYPDGSPITNIWELTLPEWKGKIMMQNPLDNVSWGSWITGFCVGDVPDQLAAAYQELTGEELVLSDGCANAGYEFLKRLHDNEPIYTSSSDEIAESVGTPGQSDPPVGFCASRCV